MMQTMTAEQLVDDLLYLDDWEDRYAYIIDLGKKLEPYPEPYKVDAYKIPGCMSNLWMYAEKKDGVVSYFFESDALIVKGLCGILSVIYNKRSPQEISSYDIQSFLDQTGLHQHITANRRSGFQSLLKHIVARAEG